MFNMTARRCDINDVKEGWIARERSFMRSIKGGYFKQLKNAYKCQSDFTLTCDFGKMQYNLISGLRLLYEKTYQGWIYQIQSEIEE